MSLFESASLVVTPNGTKASKLYAVNPVDGSGDLTVTRATTATRVNSSGLIESVAVNVPRLDYTNSTCPSILVEPQRTNLVLRSQEFDNSDWNKANCSITANNFIAPDGTTTADKLIMNNAQSGSSADGTGLRQLIDIASNSYTFSVFAKAGEFSNIRFRENQVTGAFLTVNLLNGVITNGDSNQFINAKAELYSNGWYRVSFQTPTLTALYKYSLRVSETGNGTSGIYIWGFQAEAGSYATSYIPTTSASVTRNADVISKTGISSLIGQTEGTIFVEEVYDATIANNGGLDDTLVSLTDGTSSNLISIFHYGLGIGNVLFFIRLSGTTQVAISSSTPTSGTYKIALAYKNNDVVGYINGVQIATDTSATIPATSAITLVDPITTNAATKTVKRKNVAVWKTRLSNGELSTLTTI